MREAKVKEIHKAEDLQSYTHSELVQADNWVKDFALYKLAEYLKTGPVTPALGEYVMLMARCHYGSLETDEFLKAYQCYPDWLTAKGQSNDQQA